MLNPIAVLKEHWGYNSFRSLQGEIVSAVLDKRDVLALLPTGGGKSLCFQVPAMCMEGVCLVVTPLIALMRDQVQHLKSKGIPAAYIDSGMVRKEVEMVLDNCAAGMYKFLYFSPERVATPSFQERVIHFNVNLIAVDEAHCISMWGYDFRPSYLEIYVLKDILPNVKIIALTATATQEVKKDIINKLHLEDPKLFQKSFFRPNLSYSALQEEHKERKLMEILKNVKGSAIVYVNSRAKAKGTAQLLQKNKFSADFYHAGLSYKERIVKQENWFHNKRNIIVATNAFGMGIDKPDVKSVIHMDMPSSLEAYYQEAGRAGRDEKKAFGIVLYNLMDLESLINQIQEKFPDISYLKQVYQALANYYQLAHGSEEVSYDFDLKAFQEQYSFESKKVFYALEQLDQNRIIIFNESYYSPSRLFIPDNKFLYQFQVANSKFDPFIKVLLRMFGGKMFSDFINIYESQIASNVKISKEEVVLSLNVLHKAHVLIYQQQKDKPQITFLNERYNVNDIPINHNEYKGRMEAYLKKVKSVVYYVENTKRCRSQVLLEYFEELSDKECGVCDVCVKKKREAVLNIGLKEEFEAYILKTLTENALLPEQLLTKILPKDKDYFIETLTGLVESKKIYYEASGKLKIV